MVTKWDYTLASAYHPNNFFLLDVFLYQLLNIQILRHSLRSFRASRNYDEIVSILYITLLRLVLKSGFNNVSEQVHRWHVRNTSRAQC